MVQLPKIFSTRFVPWRESLQVRSHSPIQKLNCADCGAVHGAIFDCAWMITEVIKAPERRKCFMNRFYDEYNHAQKRNLQLFHNWSEFMNGSSKSLLHFVMAHS